MVGSTCGIVCAISGCFALLLTSEVRFVRMVIPHIARNSVGLVAVGARRYIDWFGVMHRCETDDTFV